MPNATVAIRVRKVDGLVKNDDISSLTVGCVPLVYMSTSRADRFCEFTT